VNSSPKKKRSPERRRQTTRRVIANCVGRADRSGEQTETENLRLRERLRRTAKKKSTYCALANIVRIVAAKCFSGQKPSDTVSCLPLITDQLPE